jgi:FixJ family two-component response regulator
MILAQKVVARQPVRVGASDGPGQRLEGQEMWALLEKQLEQLGPLACEMWELLAQGVPLRNIAHALKISYDTAKRRRRQLFADLRASLGPEYRS